MNKTEKKPENMQKSLYKKVKKAIKHKKPRDVVEDVLDENTTAEIDPNELPPHVTGVLNKSKEKKPVKFQKSEDFVQDSVQKFLNLASNFHNLKKASRFEGEQEKKMGRPLSIREKVKMREERAPQQKPSIAPKIEQSPESTAAYENIKGKVKQGFQSSRDPEMAGVHSEEIGNRSNWLKDLLELDRKGLGLSKKPTKIDRQADIPTKIERLAASEKTVK